MYLFVPDHVTFLLKVFSDKNATKEKFFEQFRIVSEDMTPNYPLCHFLLQNILADILSVFVDNT